MKETVNIPAKEYAYEEQRESAKQSERLPVAMQDGYVDLDERSFEDLFEQMFLYAEAEMENKEECSSMLSFFKSYADEKNGTLMENLQTDMASGDLPPHIALMSAFLKLYQMQQENFNGLMSRYEDFYYRDILGFSPQKEHYGRVVVFPVLKSNVSSAFIPKGTLFDAGKDDFGTSLLYAAAEDYSVNTASVSDCIACIGKQTADADKTSYFFPIVKKEDANDNVSIPQNEYAVAICSSLFIVDGDLEVIIKNKDDSNNAEKDFCVDYTTEDGWAKAQLSKDDRIFKIEIKQSKSPITRYDAKVHGEGYETDAAIIRLNAKNLSSCNQLNFSSRDIGLIVHDSKNVALKNKFGIVGNKLGALPFGGICSKGDYFQIECPVNNAEIDQMKCSFRLDYYWGAHKPEGYGDISKSEKYYIGRNSLLTMEVGNEMRRIKVNDKTLSEKHVPCNIQYRNREFVLTHDSFDRQLNALHLAGKAIDYQINGGEEPNYLLLKAPTLESPITIDYHVDIVEDIRIYPSSPLGVLKEIVLPDKNGKFSNSTVEEEKKKDLFPISTDEDLNESHLLIGLEDVESAGDVSLYFKINPIVLHAQYQPHWYYLSEKGWEEISGVVVKDTTLKFRRSGCVVLPITEEIIRGAMAQEFFPQDRIWLKLNFQSEEGEFDLSSIEKVRTQGIELECFTDLNTSVRPPLRLKANTITKSVAPIQGIKKIEQPYDGETGVERETEERFRTRVSERLRHQGKAWTGWDYERLILAEFPQISAAKYLPCRDMEGKYKAGHVYMMVAPNPLYVEKENYLLPNISWNLLDDIYQFLKKRCTPFAKEEIHVVELQYDELKVECTVRLKSGYYDVNYYKKRLSEELVKFIAPWSDNSQVVDFTRKLKNTDVLYFIEQFDFVEQVEALKFKIKYDDGYYIDIENREEEPGCGYFFLKATRITRILTSCEERYHTINIKTEHNG